VYSAEPQSVISRHEIGAPARAFDRFTMKPFALIAGLCACGSSAPVANHVTASPVDPPPAPVAGALAGPFANRDELARTCWDEDTTPAAITSLGESRTMHAIVGLREYRHRWTAASCAITIQTAKGVYATAGFLCAADRSDEMFATKDVSVSVAGWEATIRFTIDSVTGQLGEPNPPANPVVYRDTGHYAVRCSLGPGTPSCTKLPAIGGYEHDACPRG
jgi:hypothetical protein